MTKTISRILRGALALCCLTSTSCFDIREEYWIHKNGSAEAELTYNIPTAVTRATGGREGIHSILSSILEKETRIDSHEIQVTESADSRTRIRMRVKVDDIMDLKRLRSVIAEQNTLPEPAKHLVGEISAEITGLMSMQVRRSIALGKALPALKWLPASQTQGHKIVHVVHLPHAAVRSNADEVWDEGRSLSWEASLLEAVEAPFITQIEVRLPIPWKFVLLGMAGFMLPVIALVLLIRKRRKRHANLQEQDGSAKHEKC